MLHEEAKRVLGGMLALGVIVAAVMIPQRMTAKAAETGNNSQFIAFGVSGDVVGTTGDAVGTTGDAIGTTGDAIGTTGDVIGTTGTVVTDDPFAENFVPATIEEAVVYEDSKEDPATLDCKFFHQNGKSYWYESGVRQGTYDDPKGVIGDGTIRGREIYDADTNAWYWCDSCLDGSKAVNKEVWMPYVYNGENKWSETEIKQNAAVSGSMAVQVEQAVKSGTGKWVRYNANGKMYKEWYKVTAAEAQYYPDQVGQIYYYDLITGLMAHGDTLIDGVWYHFDEVTGALKR